MEKGIESTAVLARNLNVYLAAIIRDESITTPSGDAGYAVGATRLRALTLTLQPDSLHLTQCNLVLCPVVKFGRSRRLMPGHLLGVLEASVVFQINRDAGRPPSVTSNGGEKTRRFGPLSNRGPGVVPVKCSSGHCRSSRINALEQGLSALEIVPKGFQSCFAFCRVLVLAEDS